MNNDLKLDFSNRIKSQNLDKITYKKIEEIFLESADSDFKYMDIDISPFLNFYPPKNSSFQTHTELLEMQKFMSSNQPHNFKSKLEEMDDKPANFVIDYFEEISGIKVPSNILKLILGGDVEVLAIKLKVYYNRPRPYQLAKHYGIDLDYNHSIQNNSANTPSYPSGHTLSAYFSAKVMSLIEPNLKPSLIERARMVADSRVYEGVHFKSDNDFSIYLVDNILIPSFLKSI